MIAAIFPRCRLRSSWSISSVIPPPGGQPEIVLGDHAQDEALEATKIEEAVLERERDGLVDGRARVLVRQREQAAQGERAAAGGALFQSGRVGA
jgi:hypothetical protein